MHAGDCFFSSLVVLLCLQQQYICVVSWCFFLASRWEQRVQHKSVLLAWAMSDNAPELLDISACWSPCDMLSVGSFVLNVSVGLSRVPQGSRHRSHLSLSCLFCKAPFWDPPCIVMVKYHSNYPWPRLSRWLMAVSALPCLRLIVQRGRGGEDQAGSRHLLQ